MRSVKRIDLYLTPSEAERAPLDGRQIAVVDVLRTCTSISHALQNRAGEREGRKVSGFDLGNSPRDYERAKVEGATLIFASTNASPLMAGLLAGREQRLLAYVNLGAVAEAVRKDGADLAIVCAGRNGRFSLEDAACAGALVGRLTDGAPGLALNDAAEAAREYDRAHGHAPEEILRRSDHGRYLIELGFEEDLPVCAMVDSVPVVPLLREGRILGLVAGSVAA